MADTIEIIARHYLTGEGHRVVCQNGIIESVEPAEAPADTWYAPGIFDPQVNGYAGIDFQKDGLGVQDLHMAASGLLEDGCPRWLLTLITDDWENLIDRLRYLKALRDADEGLRQAIVGWHVEGPFCRPSRAFAVRMILLSCGIPLWPILMNFVGCLMMIRSC